MIITVFSILILFLSAMACITDLRGLKIPNILPVVVMVLFIIFMAYGIVQGTHYTAYLGNLTAGVIMFVVTFILFALNMFGAGDAKLASALSFWVGLKGLSAFLFFMTATGGALGFIALAFIKYGVPASMQKGWLKTLSKEKPDIPYALAIFAGLVAGFLQAGMI